MKKLLWAILTVMACYSTGYCETQEERLINGVLKDMVTMEQITADERYDELRDKFIEYIAESINNCADCDFDLTDNGCEMIEEAADLYIDDLREREQL